MVTEELLARTTDHTDESIEDLRLRILGDAFDTSEFTEFMESVTELLGSTEFEVAKGLLEDVRENSLTIAEHTVILSEVNANLASMTTTVGNHGERITVLESRPTTLP